jgi:ribose transport system permease protein
MAVGLAVGVCNGLIITFLRVNPLVATLGTASVITGLAMIYSHSETTLITDASYSAIASNSWFGVPVPICLFVLAALVGGFFLARSVYGRFVYAVGGGCEAARLAGIRVNLIRVSVYALAGTCAALGGVLAAAQVGTAQAELGRDVPLSAISVVVIGGTSLLGGEGAMWKTVVGLLIVGTIDNVLQSLAVATSVQLLVQGSILVLAVALDTLGRRVR